VTHQSVADRWRARPVIAGLLRVVILGTPLAAGYLASLVCLRLLRHQIAATRWWLGLAVVMSVLVCVALERVTRRLLPLAALLKLSMLFPDRAPSRFKIARQALSVERLAERAAERSSQDAASAAEQALALITALTAHDRRTRGHSERVRLFTELLGEQLRLPRDARDRLRWASLLHDVGKLQVAVDILNKPAKLNNAEWDIVAAHPETGERLLGPLVTWLGEWGGAIRQHHEKFDGTGYPDGTAGSDICRAARIVAITDSYEVMTAHRAYKKPMATVSARAELARCAGTQFDPAFVRAFLAISLPRLLWAMGPASLLMNLPMLRVLADTANKGALATSQTAVLSASAAAVIGGVSATTGHPITHHAAHPALAARPAAPVHATPAMPNAGRRILRPSTPKPVTEPVAVVSNKPAPTATSLPTPSSPSDPVQTPPAPGQPPPAPVGAAPTVAFAWVPFPVIATSTASVGFTADAAAVRVLCSLDGAAASICTGNSVSYSGLADGPHTVALWAENGAGVSSDQLSTSFTVDTASATVSWTSTPPPRVASDSVTLGFSASDPAAATWCSVDGAAASVCGSPLTLTGLADGAHAVSVYTVDAVGNIGPAIQTTFTVDTTGPVVSLTSAPPATITTNTASVAFTANDPTATAWCSLDGALPTACTSPVAFAGLADGAHTVAVHAVDALGNVGPTVASHFTVDTTAPTVTSLTAPAAVVPSQSVSIPFTVDDPGATAWCSLDGALPTPCTSPVFYDALADGSHTVAIYAVDAVGNQGPARTANFTVSTTAPTVTLNLVPSPLSNSTAAAVAFTVDDPTATAWCSLDGAAPATCTSPVNYSGLGDGRHTIDIYAISLGGQQSATASTAFTVDTQAPVLTISQAPTGTVRSANATLTYAVDDPRATVWCSIDGAAATACNGPVNLGGLPSGPHTVSLYATDPAGNSSGNASASFTIDNTGPVVSFTATPPASSASRTVTVSFTTDDPASVAWCSLDGNAAQACSGSVSYNNLSNGSHSISVYAIDAAGNRGATSTTTFSVLAAAPTLLTTPPALSLFSMVTFSWVASPGLTYQYSYNGVTWFTTPTRTSYSAWLNIGRHTFRLRGIDSQGATTAVTSFTFQVL
jgi:HD domain